MTNIIKFPVGALPSLRKQMLGDLSKEQFALLLAVKSTAGNTNVFRVKKTACFNENDIVSHGAAHIKMRKEKIFDLLASTAGSDINAVIDVHTHPFARKEVFFSSVDDNDEIHFGEYLNREWKNLSYASIVLSQESYSARVWNYDTAKRRMEYEDAVVKSAIGFEGFECGDKSEVDERLNRSVLALGLDAMRRITKDQTIAVFGVGGLGSVWAENIVQSGFPEVYLIDKDTVSVSNMNRIVGATYDDAVNERSKVECISEHLTAISPSAKIHALSRDILEDDAELKEIIAKSDWVLIATDDHATRFRVQYLCREYGTPFISAGVNITVKDGSITDVSGEVITVRPGDELCLSCLGRINPLAVAHKTYFDGGVPDMLEHRGYVAGRDVHEPAVKTLNSIMAAIGTDVLINQYTGRQKHEAIWVYEDNDMKCIYADKESVNNRSENCACRF